MASIFKKAVILGCLLALSGTILWVAPVQASGGFAMSGSFYAQKLELPQGTSLSSHEIYVVIFNNSDDNLNVKVSTNVPLGVTLILPEYDFPLGAHAQKRLEVGIEVSAEAVPGDYKISITAEPYQKGVEGIQIVGGACQEADLTITGEYGVVDIIATTPDGTLVPATIVLYRDCETEDFEMSRTDTGNLNFNVSPGNYLTRAYIAGSQLAEETFSVAVDEQKTVTLSVKTVYFEGFEIVPFNHRDTGEVVMANVVCTVNNLLETFTDVRVNLLVNSDTQQENTNILNASRLEKGETGLNYNYVPLDGWREGVYVFKLELEISGEIYTTSQAKVLKINETRQAGLIGIGDAADSESITPTTSPTAETETESSVIWLIIVGVVVGILIISVIIILVIKRTK